MIEKLLSVLPKNEDSADALAIAISAHHIGDDYTASNLQQANNSLDIAIAKALLKEKRNNN
jgi:Holliday junction resolvasome RuvABC endonuclease subunit